MIFRYICGCSLENNIHKDGLEVIQVKTSCHACRFDRRKMCTITYYCEEELMEWKENG